MKRKAFFFLLLTTYYLLLTPGDAHAEGASLAITPQVITLQTQAPALINKTFSIQNKANAPIDLVIRYMPFTQKEGKDGIPSYAVDEDVYFAKDRDIFKKIQLYDGDTPIDQITLSPKQEKKLRLQITLSNDEPNADYYFSILFVSKESPLAETEQPQSLYAATTINPGIAAHVLLSIFTGNKQPEGIIQDYSAPLFVTHGPVPLTLSFENTGSYLLTPQGTVLITNMFGQTVGKISIPQTRVLNHTQRTIPLAWNEGFLLGPYQATLYMTFPDNPTTSFKRSITFIGVPISWVTGIIGVIIFTSLLWSRIKKYKV